MKPPSTQRELTAEANNASLTWPARTSSASTRSPTLVFLHMFSGPSNRVDGLKHFLQEMGADGVDVDIVNGSEFDLVDEHYYQELLRRIRAGEFDGGVISPPCSTFSNARRADGGGPIPLRTPTGPRRYGLPSLKPADKDKVKVGTLLALRAAEVFRAFKEQGKPVILEQPHWKQEDPAAVSMFDLDEYQELMSDDAVQLADFDQCLYGVSHAKRTTVIYVHMNLGASSSAAYPAGLNQFYASRLVSSCKEGKHMVEHVGSSKLLQREVQSSTQAGYHFRHPLRGKRPNQEDRHLGGMRRPGKALRTIPGYQGAGGVLHKRIIDYLMVKQQVVRQCCEALGSDCEQAGPPDCVIDEIRALMLQTFPEVPALGAALDTKLQADLMYRWAKAVNDPDADHIHRWITNGAPAGIEVMIEDGSIFPPTTDPEPVLGLHEGWSQDYQGNYTSVDDDPAAEAEVNRLLDSGFVKCFETLEACQSWVGGEVCLSKLGLITTRFTQSREKSSAGSFSTASSRMSTSGPGRAGGYCYPESLMC